MAHGGYGKRRVAGRPPFSGPGRAGGRGGLGIRHKGKVVSIKNQIRSIERMLKKALPVEVKDAQQKRLEDLKKQAELHARCELERKMAQRYRKVKFFERRKIERRIRRLEKLQRAASDHPTEEMARQAADIAHQLTSLKSDLEYIRFFPKTERYVSLFLGNDDENVIALRNKLREQIKVNLAAAAASGADIEETGSEDDGAMDMSEDDFFLVGSSSDEADADDEWTDKSSRPGDDKDDTSKEIVPLSPGIAPSDAKEHRHKKSNLGLSICLSDGAPRNISTGDSNQHQKSARDLMPPPRAPSSSNSGGVQMKSWQSSSNSSDIGKASSRPSSQSGEFTRRTKCPSSSNSWDILRASSVPTGNGSSNSDAQKPRRKRTRSKKKKKQQP